MNKQEIIAISKFRDTSLLVSSETYNEDIEFKEYIEEIYISLQNIIDSIKVNDKNKKIITDLMNGLSIQEIATNNQIKEKAVYNRIKRVVEKINGSVKGE